MTPDPPVAIPPGVADGTYPEKLPEVPPGRTAQLNGGGPIGGRVRLRLEAVITRKKGRDSNTGGEDGLFHQNFPFSQS